MTSNNEEEKRCPLCAEEMDWTDQQFNPCQCGYQVCVWCWHHIIDMAEKDDTEGRCPACRSVYHKDKIVAMQATNSQGTIRSSSRRNKPPKAKPRTEVKRDLTTVRVIQRRMVYVIGLPLSLADEDVLQRKEYFGQYGKVTKVSLSRTAGGAIQQFIHETCSVYITYSKEEEALRCIQAVHGFYLDDRLLRASFGTAKYCHAWLKNMPCNNSACLYLHSIGADEDSFGKDEVAAVHTRSRVQEIVGTGNNVINRSGSALPPPVDDHVFSPSAFPENPAVRSPASDGAHEFTDSTCTRESAVPHKMTTFVDIVGRSSTNNSGPTDKDVLNPDDRMISNLSSELSSVTVGGDVHQVEPYSAPPSLFKVSSTNQIGNGLFRNASDDPLLEDPLAFDSRGSEQDMSSSSQMACLRPSSLVDTGRPDLIQKTHSLNDFSVKYNDPIHNHEGGAFLPVKRVNSVLNDSCQETRFQSSANSDRIYRSSNSFSNEEIVEHLRRLDGNSISTNDGEDSALNAVKKSIMSIDFDSCDDSLTIPSGISELLNESDDSPGNSFNSDQSGYSYANPPNPDGFASQVAASVLSDIDNDPYFYKPQYPVTRTQSFGPPGFPVVPSRDPPPGFPSSDRTGNLLPRASSGSRLVNSTFPNMLQQSTAGFSTSIGDFNDPAILSCGRPTNEVPAPGFDMRRGSTTPHINTFDDDAKLWLLVQQSASACQDSSFSQMYAPQMSPMPQDSSYMSNGLSGLSGLSSRMVNQQQNYPTSVPQQKYANGHISNSNGYLHGMNEFRHNGELGVADVERNRHMLNGNGYLHGMNEYRHTGEVGVAEAERNSRISNSSGYLHGINEFRHNGEPGVAEVERKERLGVDSYFPGYEDLIFRSGDGVYNRAFRL